jgi:hypothetical protein
MKMVIFIGVASNMTDVIPERLSSTTKDSALELGVEQGVLAALATIAYIAAEYTVYRRINHFNKNDSMSSYGKMGIIVLSIVYFIILSFLSFLIVVHFISGNILVIMISTSVLNVVPIFIIYRILMKKILTSKMRILFWILAPVLSLALVIPYGSIIAHIFYTYLL